MAKLKRFKVKVSTQLIGYAYVDARDLASAEQKIGRGDEQQVEFEEPTKVDYIYWSTLAEVVDA